MGLRLKLFLTVFLSGAAVMIFELLGSRVLAPYVGASLYTWTALIGVILAALSLGYFYGGRWADRRPEPANLGLALSIGGALVGCVAVAESAGLLTVVGRLELALELRGVLLAVMLFALPSFFLGMVSPMAARLSLSSVEKGGGTYGAISALSTLGSIFGTFAAGYWIIPAFGTRESLLMLAVVLVSCALLWTRRKVLPVVFILVICAMHAFVQMRKQQALSAGFREFDTPYQHVIVADALEKDFPARYFITSARGAFSGFYLDDPDRLSFPILRFFDAVRAQRVPERVLVVGGAGYVYPSYLLRNFAQLKVEVVEIDPGCWRIARDYFLAKDDSRLIRHTMDARNFFAQKPTRLFDVICYDVFFDLQPPFQTTTREAFADVHAHLAETGALAVNVVDVREGKFFRAIERSLRENFRRVFVYQLQEPTPKDRLCNYGLMATDDEAFALPERFELGDGHAAVRVEDAADGFLLTDNHAPVESLLKDVSDEL